MAITPRRGQGALSWAPTPQAKTMQQTEYSLTEFRNQFPTRRFFVSLREAEEYAAATSGDLWNVGLDWTARAGAPRYPGRGLYVTACPEGTLYGRHP